MPNTIEPSPIFWGGLLRWGDRRELHINGMPPKKVPAAGSGIDGEGYRYILPEKKADAVKTFAHIVEGVCV